MKRLKTHKTLHVRRQADHNIHHGLLTAGKQTIPCILGRSGITTNKKEGDGATPCGSYRLLYGFYRKDRIIKPSTTLGLESIEDDDGWCDEPANSNYNAFVKLPFSDSHEVMKRKDRLYDICIVLDHNIDPQIKGRGSAIFFHLTSTERKPTEGCIAIDPHHMRLLLPYLGNTTKMIIHP